VKLYQLLTCALPFVADPTDGRSGGRSRFLVKGENDSMISRTSFIGALISWFTFMSLLSSLQAQRVATARISGTLTDDSGAVLVAATVQARNLEMGSSRSTVTDSGGRFAIADLPIGSYDVRASSPGFDPVLRSAIVLTVGADLVIDFTLKIGQARQDVIVNV
jgi:carboxypeptidase family protein